MQSRIIFENGGQKTFVVVLKTGEEILSCLKEFVKAERIFAAQFTAIGALSDVMLKFVHANLLVGKRDGSAMAGRKCRKRQQSLRNRCGHLRHVT